MKTRWLRSTRSYTHRRESIGALNTSRPRVAQRATNTEHNCTNIFLFVQTGLPMSCQIKCSINRAKACTWADGRAAKTKVRSHAINCVHYNIHVFYTYVYWFSSFQFRGDASMIILAIAHHLTKGDGEHFYLPLVRACKHELISKSCNRVIHGNIALPMIVLGVTHHFPKKIGENLPSCTYTDVSYLFFFSTIHCQVIHGIITDCSRKDCCEPPASPKNNTP